VRSRGRVLAVVGILVAVFAFVATGKAGSHGRGHGPRRPTHHGGGSPKWPRLIWSDDFNGPTGARPNHRKWGFDTGAWGNGELEYYEPANAKLDGRGHLVITALPEANQSDGRSYTSARLETLHTFQFEYGLVEARVEVPAGRGLWPAFWALGNNAYHLGGWPRSGEIDTMEVRGSDPYVVNGTVHGPWPGATHGIGGSSHSPTSLASGFHVYGVEWEPERISFLLDGATYETITPADLPAGSSWPFKHPYFLLLDLAVGGEWAGSPNPTTPFPAKMIVDWVRVWQ
jgi:beta-glucanase (GH16 family)